eukprot:4795448-Prymnesium_polylepis.1
MKIPDKEWEFVRPSSLSSERGSLLISLLGASHRPPARVGWADGAPAGRARSATCGRGLSRGPRPSPVDRAGDRGGASRG